MKTYITPEVEINMFDVEDVITTSTNVIDTVLDVAGISVGEVSFKELNEDLSGEVNLFK